MNAIILVGGLGSRLGKLTKNIPKPMLPIRTKPYLLHQLEYLYKNGFKNVILAAGYKHNVLLDFFSNLDEKYEIPNLTFSIENEPLGTGGAILNALDKIDSDHIFVLNGDTFIDVDYKSFYEFHLNKKSQISICVNYIKHSSRYGNIFFDDLFKLEKMTMEDCRNTYINSGNYLIKTSFLYQIRNKINKSFFSFEEKILKDMCGKIEIFCFCTSSFFIDIGVPKDYKLAQEILFNE